MKVVKVAKFKVKIDAGLTYEDLWQLQRETKEVMNLAVEESILWNKRNREHFKETGEWLDMQKELGFKTIDSHIYNIAKDRGLSMCGNVLSCTVRNTVQKIKTERKRGGWPSFKDNQPIQIPKREIGLLEGSGEYVMVITLLGKKYSKEHDKSNRVRVIVKAKDSYQKHLLEHIYSGEYDLAQSALKYDGGWVLYLSYSHEPEKVNVDPDKILGVYMSEQVDIYASSIGKKERFIIDGGEVQAFAKKIEAIVWSRQKQAKQSVSGNSGHGTKKRIEAVYRTKDKIANFRNTTNFKYAKMLVEFAAKNGYGTIQIEDLSGVKASQDFPKHLRHWTYYDLQTKIENKAAEKGIKVKKVKSHYISLRCSKCGNINSDNRSKEDPTKFICTSCKKEFDSDFNASQNLSVLDIDKIINKVQSAKLEKKTENS